MNHAERLEAGHQPIGVVERARVLLARAILRDLFGRLELRTFQVRYWDGSVEEPGMGPERSATLVIRWPGALRRMFLPPSEFRLGEAYLRGDYDVEGDFEAILGPAETLPARLRSAPVLASLLPKLAVLPAGNTVRGRESDRRYNELFSGERHSLERDADAIRFHYDVGNDFYRLWLDRRMVYSCAYFRTGEEDLDTAQVAKLDHICRKLRLAPGDRLLDIGCGWGGLVEYAAECYRVDAVGVTLSEQQASLARERIAEAGLEDRCRIEVCDYRELAGSARFDKVASVGMVEHVGSERLREYFGTVHRLLEPGGLLLNHGITALEDARPTVTRLAARALPRRESFFERYVFPDGELVPVSRLVRAAEAAGFEVRDLENLREHYALTLRHWVRRLESRRAEAVAAAGERTWRLWRLYMAISAYGFATGKARISQILLSRNRSDGSSGLPLTREALYREGTARRAVG